MNTEREIILRIMSEQTICEQEEATTYDNTDPLPVQKRARSDTRSGCNRYSVLTNCPRNQLIDDRGNARQPQYQQRHDLDGNKKTHKALLGENFGCTWWRRIAQTAMSENVPAAKDVAMSHRKSCSNCSSENTLRHSAATAKLPKHRRKAKNHKVQVAKRM